MTHSTQNALELSFFKHITNVTGLTVAALSVVVSTLRLKLRII